VLSVIWLSSGAGLVGRSYVRERDPA